MPLHLEFTGGAPIYAQIVEQIKHQVATGKLMPGEQLPTIRHLAVELRINPSTVARAYTELEHAGVLDTQQGRGTYIAEQPDEKHLARVRRDRLNTIMRTAVLEALSLGYSQAAVRETFEVEIQSWQRNNGYAA
ncbi:MAG: GntR family transcriptional regulator [Chloroflexi bacterium]|nr:GntR family transcriptional regulator [Chloroflexota bacterium]MBU1749995.1 GntR family transcriptional regulator [Chloroflexota bacterium]MBU1877435.1 GntR family transcriptional regulator [Chloroflexota bacterium]